MSTKPRKGLTSISHGRPMPLAEAPPVQFPSAVQPPAAQPAAPPSQAAPKGSAKAEIPTLTDPSGRVRVRQKDNATLVRKSWRLREHVVEALSAYCEAERWSEGTIAERAIEAYLESVGWSVDGASHDDTAQPDEDPAG